MSSFVNIGQWLVEAPDGVTLSFSKTRLNVSIDYGPDDRADGDHDTKIQFIAPESGPSSLQVPVSLSVTNSLNVPIKTSFWGVETMGGIQGNELLTGHPTNYAHFHNAPFLFATYPRWMEGPSNLNPGQTAVEPAANGGTLLIDSPDPPGAQSGSFTLYFHGDIAPTSNPFDVKPSKGDMLPPLMKAGPSPQFGGGSTATTVSGSTDMSVHTAMPFDI